ncbi:hypothetical protein OIU76_026872, partial [Salix suchowensis]
MRRQIRPETVQLPGVRSKGTWKCSILPLLIPPLD